MFQNEYDEDILAELPKSLRLMPHYQNTGGFFIAVIEKIAECDGAEPDIQEEKREVDTVFKNDLVI